MRKLKVPREALPAGINKCVEVAGWRLREALTLLETPTTAAILFTFGIEEFGKAVLLREAFETGATIAEIDSFGDHRAKVEAAGRHIPERFLLFSEQSSDAGAPLKLGFQADIEARFAGLYVDWKNGEWTVGLPVNRDVLRRSIEGAAETIVQTHMDWLTREK